MTENFFISDLNLSRSPTNYLGSLGLEPFEWQNIALSKKVKRLMLNCARQSGKSTVTAGIALHVAKFIPRSLCVLCAPSLQQSEELMIKVSDVAIKDREIVFTKDSSQEKKLENGSRILALPGTERSVRGFSGPKIILLDEASRIEDETYSAIRPMLTGAEDAKLILMSTPNGRQGFFYNEWTHSTAFTKLLVKPRYKLNDAGTEIIDDLPEAEFKAFWAEQGVQAFYSPRHTKAWLAEELDSLGQYMYRQEYDVDFTSEHTQIFSDTQIDNIFGNAPESMFTESSLIKSDAKPFDFGGYSELLFGS